MLFKHFRLSLCEYDPQWDLWTGKDFIALEASKFTFFSSCSLYWKIFFPRNINIIAALENVFAEEDVSSPELLLLSEEAYLGVSRLLFDGIVNLKIFSLWCVQSYIFYTGLVA